MRSVIFGLVCCLLLACSDSDGPGSTSPSTRHVLVGTIGLSSLAVYGTPLQEAEVLVDGRRVAHQVFSPAVAGATFDVSLSYAAAGSHRVSLRIIQQRIPAFIGGNEVAYIVGGMLNGMTLGAPAVFLKAGDSVDWEVLVP